MNSRVEPSGRALVPGPGEVGQPAEVDEALGGLGAGGEEAVAAKANALDQAPHEDVSAEPVERFRGRPVEL